MLTAFVLGILAVIALFIAVISITEMLNFLQTRVPFVPTAKADLVYMVQKAGITADDYVYDLGSGNGKVVFAVEELSGARAKGLQRGGWTQWYAQLRRLVTGSKAEFVTGNFFNHPWNEASVIYGYLYPPLMSFVEQKALAECRPGTKLVIRDFKLPNLHPQEVWETPAGHTMYYYVLQR